MSSIAFFCREVYWKLHNWMYPKQRWLTRQIPSQYMDTDDVLQLCLFTCLRHFVEREEGLLSLNARMNDAFTSAEHYDDGMERQERYRAAVLDLSDAYKWIHERDAFWAAIQESGSRLRDASDESDRRVSAEIYAHGQEEFNRRDRLHMQAIVRHCHLLWT